MDDFRVGSVSPYDPRREEDSPGSARGKKRRHPDGEDAPQEDVVVLSEQAESEGVPAEDYYLPHSSEEPE